MELTTATSIAEIIASLGVIASLIFIAREFRRNARDANLSNIAKAIETQVHQFAHLADEPEKAELLRHALVDFEGLDQSQKGQVSSVIHDIVLSHDVVRRAYESGLLPEREFRIMQHLWLSLMRTPGGRQWWNGWKSIMPDEVVAYVDTALDDPSIDAKPIYEQVPWLFALEGSTAADRNAGRGRPKWGRDPFRE